MKKKKDEKKDVARDVHCEIIVMGTYDDVTMHTDVARTFIYMYYYAQL